MVCKGERVLVGLSGGKDSVVALYLLKKIAGHVADFHAVLIDEGIPGYRDRAIKRGIEACEKIGVGYTVVSAEKEVGYSMQDVFGLIEKNPKLGSSCGFCGVFRREILNRVAVEGGYSKLATGHNLDDEAQSIAMNLFTGDLCRLVRLGPVTGSAKVDGFVPRIKPLVECPEMEVVAYANLLKLPHYSDECCPFSWMAKRNHFRKLINELEDVLPGSKYALLSTFRQLKPVLEKDAGIKKGDARKCVLCGNNTTQRVCGVCRVIEKLKMGRDVGAGDSVVVGNGKKGLSCVETKRNVKKF
jgi:uncharacterized protein (TIGR00269 family)